MGRQEEQGKGRKKSHGERGTLGPWSAPCELFGAAIGERKEMANYKSQICNLQFVICNLFFSYLSPVIQEGRIKLGLAVEGAEGAEEGLDG